MRHNLICLLDTTFILIYNFKVGPPKDCSIQFKEEIWNLLAKDFKPEVLSNMVQVISMDELTHALGTILKGGFKRRFVVKQW